MSLPVIPLKIKRGDSYTSFWRIRKANGGYLSLKDDEYVIFGVKRNSEGKEYLIKKIYTSSDFVNQGFYFTLTQAETKKLVPSTYEYDIGIKVQKGLTGAPAFYHILGLSPFIVESTVTLEEE